MPQVYRADLIFLDGEFRADCALLVGDDGRVSKVLGPGEETRHPVTQLRGKAILPGFVNAHSHVGKLQCGSSIRRESLLA